MPRPAQYGALRNVTREVLEPLWFNPAMKLDRMAAVLGVSPGGLWTHARKLGLPKRGQMTLAGCPRAEFEAMWRAGVTTAEIARACGYSQASVASARASYLGLPPRGRGTNKRGLTLAQYRETQLGRRMADEARSR